VGHRLRPLEGDLFPAVGAEGDLPGVDELAAQELPVAALQVIRRGDVHLGGSLEKVDANDGGQGPTIGGKVE
jgi:hypothetical protein